MRYAEVLGFLIFILAVLYYVLVVLQLLGIVQFTKNTIHPAKGIIPFYYFFKN